MSHQPLNNDGSPSVAQPSTERGDGSGNSRSDRRRRRADRLASRNAEATEASAEDEADSSEARLGGSILRSMPPWLVSAVFHLMLLLILAFIWLARPVTNQRAVLAISEVTDSPLNLDDTGDVQFDLDLPRDNPTLIQDLPRIDDPFAQPELPQLDVPSPVSIAPAAQISLALQGRSEGARQELLGKYGGTRESEEAVRRALVWLARQQKRDGSWSLRGPFSKGVTGADSEPAATAMALLAFQGNGNTHTKGKFKQQVADGIQWLLEYQDQSGAFPIASRHDQFYTQGLCTIALCELYGMTHDSALRAPAKAAVDFCVRTQANSGGWRYGMVNGRSQETDLSVTGWIVMGLQSARMAGLDVPEDTLDNVSRYLNGNSEDFGGRRYAYLSNDSYTPAMTAEGLLCRQYLGWPRSDDRLQDGVKYLVSRRNLPSWARGKRNVYHWYYATQVIHHMEGDSWTTWNGVMRDLLVDHQILSGKEAGSWDPAGDQWGSSGGRLYVTCLSVYILEVYYRHLPLYSNVRLPWPSG
ncbi:MAG: terpene cyclase/mutase family protein [Pirellulales bacterium]|nr:terpene cyclase/mutase family protein [Pirellulales bacterium]